MDEQIIWLRYIKWKPTCPKIPRRYKGKKFINISPALKTCRSPPCNLFLQIRFFIPLLKWSNLNKEEKKLPGCLSMILQGRKNPLHLNLQKFTDTSDDLEKTLYLEVKGKMGRQYPTEPKLRHRTPIKSCPKTMGNFITNFFMDQTRLRLYNQQPAT